MLIPRVIPCLLVENGRLVKTVRFSKSRYIGDPLNAIRIFNEKQVDELILLDIAASANDNPPPFQLIENVASECFMPLCYGGNVRTIKDMDRIFDFGVEKISVGSCAVEDPDFITEASARFGSQSIVVCLDVKHTPDGYHLTTQNGQNTTALDPVEYAVKMQDHGAGELLINSVDRDGVMNGYDIELIRAISSAVTVPVVACGGAGSLQDIVDVVVSGGASSGAAGSLFIYHGRLKAVLINYPDPKELETLFNGVPER